MSKAEEGLGAWAHGRWWGVRGKLHIPWGKRIVVELTAAETNKLLRVVRCYVRSIIGRKLRMNSPVVNVFINESAVWERLVPTVIRCPF